MQLNSVPGFSFIQKLTGGTAAAQPTAEATAPTMSADTMQQSPAVRVARLKQDLAHLDASITPNSSGAERVKIQAQSAQIQALIDNGGKPLTGRSAALADHVATLNASITKDMSAGQLAAVSNNIELAKIQLGNGGKPLLAGAAYTAGLLNDLNQQLASGKLSSAQTIGAQAQSVVRLAQIRTDDSLSPAQVDAARNLLTLSEQAANPGVSAADLQKIQFKMAPLMEQLQPAKPAAKPAPVAGGTATPDTKGITAKDAVGDKQGNVHAEQNTLNEWLKTDGGKAFLATDAGKALGAKGQLKTDGFEGPLTRAVKNAYGEATKPGLQQDIAALQNAKTSATTYIAMTKLNAEIFAKQAQLDNGGLPLTGAAGNALHDLNAVIDSITTGTSSFEMLHIKTQLFAVEAKVKNGGAPFTGAQAELMDKITALGANMNLGTNHRDLAAMQMQQESLKIQFNAGEKGLSPEAAKALSSVADLANAVSRGNGLATGQLQQMEVRSSVGLATARAGGTLTGDAQVAAQEINRLANQLGAPGVSAARVQRLQLQIADIERRLP